ncbi:MAG TPA: AsmA family protein [Terriglobales bacterium]|nr:AsmA family protein [Terriglobales bacterium]
MKFFRSRFGVASAVSVLILALFLIRPGADRLKTRIVSSISSALGRQVEASSVNLQFLPQPGFELENFAVHDDPSFGAEPMLRAAEVTAGLRLTSLLHGRLEISKLSLSEPSLNLIRNGGKWNVETLLERAAKLPVAPTGKTKSESRPAFPYIQANRARINFKVGLEKKPYSLSDADFGLWQESENSWGMRLKAQPIRTDLNLSDTGMLTVTGSWQRAATLRETPVQFTFLWQQAQLGQATKLIRGSDAGWRGTIRVSASLEGTPADLVLKVTSSLQDFRRYDIVGGDALALGATCNGHYSSVDLILSNINCQAPVGQGDITMTGSIAGGANSTVYSLELSAHDVPAQSLLGLARHTKANLPDDLVATGKLNANVGVQRDLSKIAWHGNGEAMGLHVRSSHTTAELVLEKIPLAISPETNSASTARNRRTIATNTGSETRLEVGPFNVALGRPAPAVVRAWFSRSGYNLSIIGDVQLQRLLQLARNTGVPSAQTSMDGPARIDLQLAGNWQGFALHRANGKVQLHSIQARIRGLEKPVEIESANLELTQDQVIVQNVNALMAGATWRGSLALPRLCATPGTCPIRFNLHANEIATDQLNQNLNPEFRKRSWYQLIPSSTGTSLPLTLLATGRLTADRVQIHKLAAHNVSANVELNHGKLMISDLRGDVLGGHHSGNWKADFTVRPPVYSGNGTLHQVALEDLADLMHDDWIGGTADATYEAATSGLNLNQLVTSATAKLQVDGYKVILPHIILSSASGPLQASRFLGNFHLRDSSLDFEGSKLETEGDIYRVSGTTSLGQDLHLKLERDGAAGFDITGTLAEPRISPINTHEAEAALKP